MGSLSSPVRFCYSIYSETVRLNREEHFVLHPMQNPSAPIINLDQPLTVGSALENDKLNRREFAENAARILTRPDKSGFAISIEGGWGSGKSSTLAMIEEFLKPSKLKVAHFNPWLIGSKEDLLEILFSEIALKINYNDLSSIAKRATKNLLKYINVITDLSPDSPIGFLKRCLIGILKFVGKDTEEWFQTKLSKRKEKLEEALNELFNPIIVFIDDIDRLTPKEVFEMVRVIKAVGHLPNIRYVCAWEPLYVGRALESASISNADTYLDKIIQVRLPLPILSDLDRRVLLNGALDQLSREALDEHFQGGEELLESFYFRALSPIISHPRDINRIFSIVSTIEPKLRGEIVLSDIIGIATIMAKAPKVFDLLKKHKEWFSGYPDEYPITKDKRNRLAQEGISQINKACQDCESPTSIENLINYLFPLTQKKESLFPKRNIEEMKGHLAAPQRLKIALQLNVSSSEVSLVKVRRFLISPNHRDKIKDSLKRYNCLDFLKAIEKKTDYMFRDKIHDLDSLCLSIARLIDKEYFKSRSDLKTTSFIYPQPAAERTISKIINFASPAANSPISDLIVRDPQALSLASHILTYSYFRNRSNPHEPHLEASPDRKEELISYFSENILSIVKRGFLFNFAGSGNLLNQLPSINSNICPQVFKEMKASSAGGIIEFIRHLLPEGWDSSGGHYYNGNLPLHIITAYCPIEDLKGYAKSHLNDIDLSFSTKIALRAFIEEKVLYSETGLEADRSPTP